MRRMFSMALLAMLLPAVFRAQETSSSAALTAGPYVRWLGDTAVAVQSVCTGIVKTATVRVPKNKAVTFANPCSPADVITVSAAGQHAVPAVVTKAKKVMALSDVEGDYDTFVSLLQKAGVL